MSKRVTGRERDVDRPDEAYRKRTRMFGPVWCWVILGGILALLAGVPYLSPA
ncbi:MAG: hypothetical protein H8D77_00255 [Chloroflexi bacterium]|nr:hypothetical protein [Chloroflexota bacterium]